MVIIQAIMYFSCVIWLLWKVRVVLQSIQAWRSVPEPTDQCVNMALTWLSVTRLQWTGRFRTQGCLSKWCLFFSVPLFTQKFTILSSYCKGNETVYYCYCAALHIHAKFWQLAPGTGRMFCYWFYWYFRCTSRIIRMCRKFTRVGMVVLYMFS